MARRTETYAIRLAVEGGGQVKAELVTVGQSGEQSLKRIETAGGKASGGLKDLGRQAELLRTGMRTLGGALAGVATWAASPRWSIDPSRRRMRSARLPTRSGSASRPCRNCVSQRRHPGSSSRPSTWRCSASPAARPRRRRARARPRTHWRRWALRCATRAATCAAVPPDAVFGAIRPLRRGSQPGRGHGLEVSYGAGRRAAGGADRALRLPQFAPIGAATLQSGCGARN